MANFEELRRALHAWMQEVLAELTKASQPEMHVGLRQWQRDDDGFVRLYERPRLSWNHALFGSPAVPVGYVDVLKRGM